jgi:pimeloyl-ACP methyl ester carboxylesterase
MVEKYRPANVIDYRPPVAAVHAAGHKSISGCDMPQFDHQGASVHFEVLGDGPPLLLIAGTASDGASWGPLLPLLRGRQLILIDNRGSGRTKVEGALTHADMVEDCAALIDHLGLGAVDVVGHSLGGFLGLWLAALHPEKVKRLVTMSSGLIDARSKTVFQDLSRLYFTVPPQDFFRLLYPWLFSPPFFSDSNVVTAAAEASTAYPYRQSPGDFARQIAAMARPLQVDLATIQCPVLAITGDGDLLAPPAAVAAGHARIPDHRLVTIPNAAHSIHWERPDAVADAITAFLG